MMSTRVPSFQMASHQIKLISDLLSFKLIWNLGTHLRFDFTIFFIYINSYLNL